MVAKAKPSLQFLNHLFSDAVIIAGGILLIGVSVTSAYMIWYSLAETVKPRSFIIKKFTLDCIS